MWLNRSKRINIKIRGFSDKPIVQPSLGLKMADKIANKVIQVAKLNNLPPVVVTVVDPSGEIIVTKRMDGSTPAFAKFAYAKAWTAACFKI